jgi:ABC-type sugar transport system substrate-binding protein
MFHSSSLRRATLSLALLASLAAVPTAPLAAAPSGQPARQIAVRPLGHGWLTQLWGLMTAIWGREGTTLDPSGKH